MIHRLLADLVLSAHLFFVLFAVLGGLLILRWRHALWPHLAALAWGVYVQFGNRRCPLTPLENYFRRMGGEAGYEGGFIEHYVSLILYPEHLTLTNRVSLGLLLLAVNLLVYSYLILDWRKAARLRGGIRWMRSVNR